MPGFNAPTMGHRLILQLPTDSVSTDGELLTDWTTIATIWGAFTASKVRREEEAQQMVEVQQHQIVIRYRDDVANGWRLLLDDREISILTVIDPDQSKRFLSCACEEAARR